jgi:hypothetical protein
MHESPVQGITAVWLLTLFLERVLCVDAVLGHAVVCGSCACCQDSWVKQQPLVADP